MIAWVHQKRDFSRSKFRQNSFSLAIDFFNRCYSMIIKLNGFVHLVDHRVSSKGFRDMNDCSFILHVIEPGTLLYL